MRFTSKQIAVARAAGALNGIAFAPTSERTPEQLTGYTTLLAAFNGDVAKAEACYARAAQADEAPVSPIEAAKRANASTAKAAKAEPKPERKPATPKAEKPAKPADATKAAAASEREKLINDLRASVSTLYNQPSLAVRSNPKRIALSVYESLLANPKHRTTLDRVSTRDESALFLIIKRGDANAAFDPALLNLDSGIFSRLASVGFIEAAPSSSKLPFRLTKAGASHARKTVARAAA